MPTGVSFARGAGPLKVLISSVHTRRPFGVHRVGIGRNSRLPTLYRVLRAAGAIPRPYSVTACVPVTQPYHSPAQWQVERPPERKGLRGGLRVTRSA